MFQLRIARMHGTLNSHEASGSGLSLDFPHLMTIQNALKLPGKALGVQRLAEEAVESGSTHLVDLAGVDGTSHNRRTVHTGIGFETSENIEAIVIGYLKVEKYDIDSLRLFQRFIDLLRGCHSKRSRPFNFEELRQYVKIEFVVVYDQCLKGHSSLFSLILAPYGLLLDAA